MRRSLAAVLAAVWLAALPDLTGGSGRIRLSFHNRLLLNRIAVSGQPTVEVMLAVSAGAFEPIAEHVNRLRGRVVRSDDAVGYLRVEVPTGRFLDLVAHDGLDAYQISSSAQGVWYRDGPPQRNAEMFRRGETQPPVTPQEITGPALPALSVTRGKESGKDVGYAAGEDAGVSAWLATHPRADGRGVTIALLESGLADFDHPTARSARSLDGREVKKIVGILNTIDSGAPDATRVELNVTVQATSRWSRVGLRTYIFPRPGGYHLGLFVLPAGDNVTHQFAVIEDERSGEVWVDANGNNDFSDEPPMSDINARVDVRRLRLVHPRSGEVSFVVARGRVPRTVHVYLATGGHQAMTLSVAAGSRTEDSPAAGVAPGAQVLLVRRSNTGARLDDYIEGYLEAARRPDVDLLCDSSAVHVLPDTAADFVAVILDRLVHKYGKPIFRGAGNLQLRFGSATSSGDVFSVGGTLGPRAFEAFYGGAPLRELIVHPVSAAGPALDGAIKPDFLAPVHVVAADVQGGARNLAIPVSAPASRLPPGHQISCCTSASSPYAAGVAALIISRAKQEGIPYSVASLGRALRLGSRFLPGTPAHQQGNGVLSLEAAWRELTNGRDDPRISSSARIVAPLAMYAARGEIGSAIFERDGWFVGRRETRALTLRRESGAPGTVVYKVSWTGNDGTFGAPQTVTLPLGQTVALPVTIAVTAAGAHSALLNLHDASSGAIRFRTQATIVAAERFEAADRPLAIAGRVPLLGYRAHYVAVPDGVGALVVELRVTRGILNTTILRGHGLSSGYYDTVNPTTPRAFGPGAYSATIPRPEPGTWTVSFANDTAWRDSVHAPASTSDAEYTVTLRLLGASVVPRTERGERLTVEVTNRASTLEEPVLDVTDGILRSRREAFLATGIANQYPIDVPADTAALTLSSTSDPPSALHELFLYDCTTGQCFSQSFTVPAARSQTLVVHQPRAGRWVVAVNAAPFVPGSGSFVLEEVVTTGQPQRIAAPSQPRRPGDKWSYDVPLFKASEPPAGFVRVLRLELVDLAFARDVRAHPWEDAAAAREVAAAGTATYIRR